MLAVHELEEIKIGDLTQFEIAKEEKEEIGHEAVSNILNGLLNKDQIMNLVLEFDERKTKEALFAYYCDKLECDIQSKIYDSEGCVDLNNQEGNQTLNNPKVKELQDTGKSWSDMWITFGQDTYGYDEHFMEVSKYVNNQDMDFLRKYK